MKQASIPDFTDQRVWVIGASSGIGEACARALLKRGAKLALSSRRIERLEAIAQSADPSHSLVVPVDVMDPSSIAHAYQTIKAQWGGIDLLLFVSGIYIPLRADDFNMEDAQKTNKVNQASIVGKKIAEVAAQAGIEKVVFDRNGYLYHGRIKSLADSAREGGLKF